VAEIPLPPLRQPLHHRLPPYPHRPLPRRLQPHRLATEPYLFVNLLCLSCVLTTHTTVGATASSFLYTTILLPKYILSTTIHFRLLVKMVSCFLALARFILNDEKRGRDWMGVICV
jgi:hypothetical protein